MPVFFVVLILLQHQRFWFFFSHLLSISSLAVRSDLALLDTLFEEVWLLRIILRGVFNDLTHALWMPIQCWVDDVRRTIEVLWLMLTPFSSHFCVLIIVMHLDLSILLTSQKTDTRRPDKHSHDVMATDPTFVFCAGTDLPLGWARQQLFMT